MFLIGFCTAACGFCEDADGNTSTCSLSEFACEPDIDCLFGVADLGTAPTTCSVDSECTSVQAGGAPQPAGFDTNCSLSDDCCNPVIDAVSGGEIPRCCSPFEDFAATANASQLP